MQPFPAIASAKRELRRSVRELRRALSPEERLARREGFTRCAATLAERAEAARATRGLGDTAAPAAPLTVAAYLPAATEPDPLGAMRAWHAAGLRVLVPISLPARRLAWAQWTPQTRIGLGALAPVPEPVDAAPADPTHADLIVVPALAVARDGRRLGQGGGFYDSFLSDHPAPTVGCIYDEERLDAVPHDAWDAVLGAIWTPSGVVDLPAPAA